MTIELRYRKDSPLHAAYDRGYRKGIEDAASLIEKHTIVGWIPKAIRGLLNERCPYRTSQNASQTG